MDTDWLQTFVTAAKEENFHRAADKLHLSQPTVSTQIGKLEELVGAPLFHRYRRGVVLTRAGQLFLPYAQQALDTVGVGIGDVARLLRGVDTVLRIAVSPLVATSWLPLWIRSFGRDRPEVEFSVQVAESADILPQVLAGACDIGFTRLAVTHARADCLHLYDDPVRFLAPVESGDADTQPPTFTELLGRYPLLTHNHPGYWDQLAAEAARFVPALRQLRVSQVHVTIRWIIERMGVSFLPQSTVRRELAAGAIDDIAVPIHPLPVAATYLLLDAARASATARDFADHVAAAMAVR